MKIAITGDSFTQTYKKSWLENLCNFLNFSVVSHQGYGGQSEYRIYRNFKEILNFSPEIILCCHTHHSRLYHPYEPVSSSYHGIKNPDVINASKQYFEHLYDDNFARDLQNLMIKDMQNTCKEKNIKLINIPCFEHSHIEKFYGLWIISGQGLMECSKTDYKKTFGEEWTNQHYDNKRINHFSESGNQIIFDNIHFQIKYYLENNMDYHISLIFPELFA